MPAVIQTISRLSLVVGYPVRSERTLHEYDKRFTVVQPMHLIAVDANWREEAVNLQLGVESRPMSSQSSALIIATGWIPMSLSYSTISSRDLEALRQLTLGLKSRVQRVQYSRQVEQGYVPRASIERSVTGMQDLSMKYLNPAATISPQ